MKKVKVFLNGQLTGIGTIMKNEDVSFRVAEGNIAVHIKKRLSSFAKLGIYQFDKENVVPFK